jgi:hypothetical protein
MSGITRSSSSSSGTGGAPGRVDSPPMSMMSAPSTIIRSAWRSASPRIANLPPSEKESGVTFRMPITNGRSKVSVKRPHCSGSGVGKDENAAFDT